MRALTPRRARGCGGLPLPILSTPDGVSRLKCKRCRFTWEVCVKGLSDLAAVSRSICPGCERLGMVVAYPHSPKERMDK